MHHFKSSTSSSPTQTSMNSLWLHLNLKIYEKRDYCRFTCFANKNADSGICARLSVTSSLLKTGY